MTSGGTASNGNSGQRPRTIIVGVLLILAGLATIVMRWNDVSGTPSSLADRLDVLTHGYSAWLLALGGLFAGAGSVRFLRRPSEQPRKPLNHDEVMKQLNGVAHRIGELHDEVLSLRTDVRNAGAAPQQLHYPGR